MKRIPPVASQEERQQKIAAALRLAAKGFLRDILYLILVHLVALTVMFVVVSLTFFAFKEMALQAGHPVPAAVVSVIVSVEVLFIYAVAIGVLLRSIVRDIQEVSKIIAKRRNAISPFITGMAAILDFGDTLNDHRIAPDEKKADYQAIKSDWEQVGRDLGIAMERVEEEYAREIAK